MKYRVKLDEIIEAESFEGALGVVAREVIDLLTVESSDLKSMDVRRVDAGEPPAAGRPRTFILQRDEDETGVSGVGTVAWGVEFPDGNVVTRWNADIAQTCVWASLDQVIAVHGHQGKTRVIFLEG